MIGKIIQTIIVIAVSTVAFLVIYYSEPKQPSHQKASEASEHLPVSPVKPSSNPPPSSIPSQETAPSVEKPPQHLSQTVTEEHKAPVQHTDIITVPHNPDQPIHVGILGEGQSVEAKNEGFNSTVLRQLFEVFKKRKVDAIFFTGDLVSGALIGKDNESHHSSIDILKEQLDKFSSILTNELGSKIPFFPALGSSEISILKKHSEIFFNHFHLDDGVYFKNHTFAYGVSIGSAFFAVIPSDAYNPEKQGIEAVFDQEMQKWLKDTLEKASKTHKYIFVIGHEPAFPTTSAFVGERILRERDAFWQILGDNGVIAYFASHERLYDRSYRRGEWQVISGGAGAPITEGESGKPFYHALILTIPVESELGAQIDVVDVKGEIIDSLELRRIQFPLYQYHISKRD